LDEKKLIKLARKGDANAFGELIKAYGDMIYNVSLRLSGSREEAEDLTQEAFLKAYRNIKKFNGSSSFSTWVYRIAENFWIDRNRRKKIIKFMPFLFSETSFEFGYVSEPETIYESKEKKELISEALLKLTPSERKTVVLSFYEGKSYKEIAKMEKCSIGTVGSRLTRGIGKLRKFFNKKYKHNEMRKD